MISRLPARPAGARSDINPYIATLKYLDDFYSGFTRIMLPAFPLGIAYYKRILLK